MKKKIAIVGTVGLPACYGGFESLVDNLTKEASSNIDYHVFCSSKTYAKKMTEYNRAKLHYINLSANGVKSIFYDISSLIKCLKLKPDTILILGVSGCIILPLYRLFSSSKIVTNIDGLEWKRDKWSFWAKKFLKFSEKIAVKFSDEIIADNQAISDYVREEYTVTSKTIAYGGDHAVGFFDDKENLNESYSLALCRIEPENNVELILEAFSKASNKRIKFIGNWNKSSYGLSLKNKYSQFNNIDIVDPIYGLDELFKLRTHCDIYIHGHSAGGTNPSLVEAMFFSKPILAFDCIFNRYSTENKALYFSSVSELITHLSKSEKLDLTQLGRALYHIADKNYRWLTIVNQYESSY